MASTLSLVLVVLLCLSLYRFLIYPVFLSPLSKIPNAYPLASITPLWMLWIRKQHREVGTIHAAHQRLGPIVRLAPNELSVSCVDGGVRTIYPGGFAKHAFYPNMFDNFGVPNMFSTAESRPHSVRKRMVTNIYSKSYLQSSEALAEVVKHIIYKRLFPLLNGCAEPKEPVDVLQLNYAAMMDGVNGYVFGLAAGSNLIEDVRARKDFLHLYQSRKDHTYFPQELPGFTRFMSILRLNVVPLWVDAANRKLEDWCLDMCRKTERQIRHGELKTKPEVYTQLSDSLKRSDKESLSGPKASLELSVASELFDHVAAGHETSGITLTYLMWQLSLHLEWQAQLRNELCGLVPRVMTDKGDNRDEELPELPTPRDIDALPILHALILETLRLHSPIPGPQPRITPNPSCTLAGHGNIPPGVRVSSQAYTLHRNPAVFQDPECWKPERWLEADEPKKADMLRYFWAFGSGGRMCVGSNFAMQEMKLYITAIYSNFSTQIVDDTGIEQADGYTVGPVGNKLILSFEKV